mgnify:CR=1 FL=1
MSPVVGGAEVGPSGGGGCQEQGKSVTGQGADVEGGHASDMRALKGEIAAVSARLKSLKSEGASRSSMQPLVDELLSLKTRWSSLSSLQPQSGAAAEGQAQVRGQEGKGQKGEARGALVGELGLHMLDESGECEAAVVTDAEGKRRQGCEGKRARGGKKADNCGERGEELGVSNKNASEIAAEWGFQNKQVTERVGKKMRDKVNARYSHLACAGGRDDDEETPQVPEARTAERATGLPTGSGAPPGPL